MALSDEDVREILRLIDESQLAELRIETEGLSLYVRRGETEPTVAPAASARVAGPSPAPPSADGVGNVADGLHTIESPMLGTFYRAEGPGGEPFVEAGSQVEPDTIVCIIEVMKMMNSVPAGVSGTVVEICSENASLVEYGAPLFRVEPA
jgi:acetyl-CoA carboxylase biotin carboxyl carrier protein